MVTELARERQPSPARLDTGGISPQISAVDYLDKPSPGPAWWPNRRVLRGHHARLVGLLRKMDTGELGLAAEVVAYKWRHAVERCPGVTRRHDSCGRASFTPHSCDFALCPWCQRRRSDKARRKLSRALDLLAAPMLLTFNPPNVKDFTPGAVAALIKVFTGLRREKVLENVAGGVRSVETTWRGAKGWNLHLHALVDSPWIAHYTCWDIKRVGERWVVDKKHEGLARAFTVACQKYPELSFGTLRPELGKFDADNPNHWYYVELRRADSGAVAEVVKYIAKGSEIVAGGSGALVDFLAAIKGRRMIQPFGSLYDVDLDDSEDEDWEAEAEGECPYDDCPAPGTHKWEFVNFGPGNWVLDRDSRTGGYRLKGLARDGPLLGEMYYGPARMAWPSRKPGVEVHGS